MNSLVERYLKYKRKDDFALIYRKYADPLYRFLLSRTGNVHLSEEVLSDTFYALLELIEKYDSNRSKFETFLFGIALNKLRQMWSKQKVNKFFTLDEEIELDEFIPNPRRKYYVKKIKEGMDQLIPRYRKIIQLRFLEMRNLKEVSEVLGISISNVTTLQNRAINKLKEIVSEKEVK